MNFISGLSVPNASLEAVAVSWWFVTVSNLAHFCVSSIPIGVLYIFSQQSLHYSKLVSSLYPYRFPANYIADYAVCVVRRRV